MYTTIQHPEVPWPMTVFKTTLSPSSGWPQGENVLFELNGHFTLFMWQPDKGCWTNYGRLEDD